MTADRDRNIHITSDPIWNQSKIITALEVALDYGQIQGEHHKAWVIDQMVRILTGDKYSEEIKDYCNGEDGPNTYAWDEGVAP